MKAWRLERLGGDLSLKECPVPDPRPGSVLVRMHASALLSYLKSYVRGELPTYRAPPGPFTIGTNGVGEVVAVGREVWHLKPGQRVVLLIGLTTIDPPARVSDGFFSGCHGRCG